MTFLTESPVSLITSMSQLQAGFVVFCASMLGTIAIVWVVTYLLFRPIPRHCVFTPFEHLSRRAFDIGTVFVSAVSAYAASVVLKGYFRIGRPEALHFDFHALFSLSDYGFPSGHASFFSAMAVALFFIHRRAGIFASLLALTIGAARIFAGVHTPLDILGGYILGTLCALVVDTVASRVSNEHLG